MFGKAIQVANHGIGIVILAIEKLAFIFGRRSEFLKVLEMCDVLNDLPSIYPLFEEVTPHHYIKRSLEELRHSKFKIIEQACDVSDHLCNECECHSL